MYGFDSIVKQNVLREEEEEIDTPQEQSQIEDIGVELDPEMAPIDVVGLGQSVADEGMEIMDIDVNAQTTSGEKCDSNTQSVFYTELDNGGISFTEQDEVIMNSQPTQYSYFKPSLLQRAWTGPTHWKLNRVTKKHPKSTHEHKKRSVIQFSPDHCINPSHAFPAVKRTSDLMMNESAFEAKGLHILPEDHHYSFEVCIDEY